MPPDEPADATAHIAHRPRAKPPPWTTRTLLRVADALRRPIAGFGVDYPQFRSLLELRLTLDARRAPTPDGSFRHFGMAATSLFFAAFGVGLGLIAAQVRSPALYTSIVTSVVFFLGTISVAVYLSEQLFDPSIDTLLAPRPVVDATAMAARVAIVLADVLVLCAPFVIPTLLIGSFRYGVFPFAPAFAIASLLASMLGTALLVLSFGIAMRVLSVERFKRFITQLQVVFAIVLMIGPQVLARMTDPSKIAEGFGAAVLLYPPTWFGRVVALASGAHDVTTCIGAGLAVVLPFAAIRVAFRLLKDRFIAAQTAPASTRAARRVPFLPPIARIARRFVRDREELAGVELALSLLGRERGLLMRTLPQLAFPVVMLMSFVWQPRHGGDADSRFWWWIVIHFCGFITPTVAFNLQFSDTPEAAWAFDAAPIVDRSRVLAGVIRAALGRFVIGPAFLCAVVISALTGRYGFVDAISALALATAESVTIARMLANKRPFARTYTKEAASDLMGIAMLHLCGMFAVIGVQSIGQFWAPWRFALPFLAIPFAAHVWRSIDDVDVESERRKAARQRG